MAEDIPEHPKYKEVQSMQGDNVQRDVEGDASGQVDIIPCDLLSNPWQ